MDGCRFSELEVSGQLIDLPILEYDLSSGIASIWTYEIAAINNSDVCIGTNAVQVPTKISLGLQSTTTLTVGLGEFTF